MARSTTGQFTPDKGKLPGRLRVSPWPSATFFRRASRSVGVVRLNRMRTCGQDNTQDAILPCERNQVGRINTRVPILTLDRPYPGRLRRRPLEAHAAQPPAVPFGARLSGSLGNSL